MINLHLDDYRVKDLLQNRENFPKQLENETDQRYYFFIDYLYLGPKIKNLIKALTLHKFLSFHPTQKQAKNLDTFLAILQMSSYNILINNNLQAFLKNSKNEFVQIFTLEN